MKKDSKLLLLVTLLLIGCDGSDISNSSFKPGISIINPTSDTSEEISSQSEEIVSSEKVSSEENFSSEKVSSSSEMESSNNLSSIEEIVSIEMSEELKNYYSPVDFSLEGTALMADLENLLDSTDNTSFSYSSLFTVFAKTDIDPDNPDYMLSFYSGVQATRSQMNREHVWPNSRGGFLVEDDPHCIRPTLTSENSSRGNSFYNENSTWDPGSLGNEKYRGIAARIIFYCAVKAYSEGLYLVDKSDDPQLSSTNSITKKKWNPTMGKLSTLLEWNLEYGIDETEEIRNEVLYDEYNHCRNPFIDNRDLPCQIWGDTSEETKKVCNKN